MAEFDAAFFLEDLKSNRLSEIDLASRKAEEASLRRYEACGWLKKTVGAVGGRDLPAQPSEEEFRLGLRSGIVLCNALNKVLPGSVPKVVEPPSNDIIIPDGAALSAYQYFENIRNFLDSIGQMRIPAFEASDLEQGGNSSRVVNCVLALKSYHDWKQGGGKGTWKFSGNVKPPSTGKQIFRRNSDLFVNSLSKNSSTSEMYPDFLSTHQNVNEMDSSNSLHILVRELLQGKTRQDIPLILENMLGKVVQEFECRLAGHNAKPISSSEDMLAKECNMYGKSQDKMVSDLTKDKMVSDLTKYRSNIKNSCCDCESSSNNVNNLVNFQSQQRSIQELKTTLHSTKEEMQMLVTKYQEEVICFGKHINSLAHAASGYHKVLEENRKLYNQVQDLKGNIRVYCRIRPSLSGQSMTLNTVEVVDEHTLSILASSKYGKGKKSFTFNRVFSQSASQEEVFSDTQPLIRSVLDGYNVCIFAYGQTGSGKTYTMSGAGDLSKERLGVNYRALRDLFHLSEQRKESMAYEISVQVIEIYNEKVRDLLVTDDLNKRLEIRNSSINGVNVPDANIIPVSSTSDVINLMNLGNKNRAVGSTAMNDRSSRSHSCLTVHVQGRELTSGSILRGCMHLVDLAGSERADKSEAVGERLKEAQHINRSLSALGDVIASLAQKNSHVPYRNSKLTQLLQDSLGGQAKTLMFVHISPEPDALGETLSTLKFAERVATVELGAAKVHKETADIKRLKDQIASLKEALLRKEKGDYCVRISPYSSPDRTKSSGSSPSHSSWKSTGNLTQAEGWSSSSSTSRKQSLGGLDLMDSHPWPQLMVEEEGYMSGDWIDKVIVKKHRDGENFTEMLYQKHGCDAATEVSDDLGAETSNSSEVDYQWRQLNLSRTNSTANGKVSKIGRPSPKQTKIPETRSLIPQPPTRKVASPSYHKQVRQAPASSVEGKTKSVGGK